MILNAVLRAVGQMPDPRFRNVLLTGVGLSLALLVGFSIVMGRFVRWLVGDGISLPFVGPITWLNDVAGWGTLAFLLIGSVFLMIPVASAITSMFLDRVADAVEDRHYPTLPPAASVPFLDGLRDTFGFLGVLIAANIVALVLYLLFFLVAAPFAPFIFWGLNGFLLGREYFQLAAMRRVGREGARALRSRHRYTIWAAGILMAIPLTVPILNLLVPVIGAATFTHLFHALQARHPSG